MITLVELALQNLDHAELLQRAVEINNIVQSGCGVLHTYDDGHVDLLNVYPMPRLPMLWLAGLA